MLRGLEGITQVGQHAFVRPMRFERRAVAALALTVVLSAIPSDAFAACGDRGGPGYRGPNGKCVGWDALARVCGNPPTQRCTAETTTDAADKAAEHGAKIIDIQATTKSGKRDAGR